MALRSIVDVWLDSKYVSVKIALSQPIRSQISFKLFKKAKKAYSNIFRTLSNIYEELFAKTVGG